MGKVWGIRNPIKPRGVRKHRPAKSVNSVPHEKDPAKAYSWSVLVWGGGQFYNNQVVKGLSYLFFMAAFHSGFLLTLLYWDDIVRHLKARGMSVSIFLLVLLVLFLCALIFRSLCCTDAYRVAMNARKNRFTGTGSRVFPFLCSLLKPGWGQFLNGQPFKGSIFAGFSIVSYFSLFAVPIVMLTWNDLEPSSARSLVESICTIAVLFLPLIPFIWIFGGYDALKISREEWKKKPLWERIQLSKNLFRNKVWVRRVIHQTRQTFIFLLFFTFFIIMFYYYCPREFYSGRLTSARSRLQTQGMILLPDLLGKLSHRIAANGDFTSTRKRAM